MSNQSCICKSGSYYVRKSEIDQYASTSRLVRSFGVTCIAVQGRDSMFVVTRDNFPDIKRLQDCLESILLAYVVDNLRALQKGICAEMYPLGVVHMPLCIFGPAEPADDVGQKEKEAVTFLENKIKGGYGFDFGKTIQTGIQALQILHGETYNAKDIQVCYLVKDNLNVKSLAVKKIENHLKKINPDVDPK